VLGPYYQVVVANYLRLVLTEERRQPRLELILVSDQQVTGRAVPTGLVQGYELQRVDVDDQRQLAHTRLAAGLGAGREPRVGVGIQEEPVARRLLTEAGSRPRSAFFAGHQSACGVGSIPSDASQASSRSPIRPSQGGSAAVSTTCS